SIDREHVHRPRLLGVADRRAVPGRDGKAPREDEEPQRLRHRVSAVLGAADGDRTTVTRRDVAQPFRAAGAAGLKACATTVVLSVTVLGAQTRFSYSTGQSVSPAYEGWNYAPDGTIAMYFGYMNSNWLQEFDVPVGPENSIEPGGPDQGQPTHFYPRRSPFL